MAENRFSSYAQEKAQNRFSRYAGPARGGGDFDAFLSGAADAASFGFGDELKGLVFGEEERDAARARQEQYRADNGGAFLGGQVAGALASGFGAGGALRAGAALAPRLAAQAAARAAQIGPLGRIAGAALTGAAGGAAYGAGDAREGGRAEGALAMAPWGAVGGAAGQAAFGELLPFVAGKIGRAVSPEARAASQIGDRMQRYGQTPADLRGKLTEQAPFGGTLMDAMTGGPELVNQAAVRPSAAKLAARELYDNRNNAVAGQAIDDAWQTLNGTTRGSAAKTVAELEDVQKRMAEPLYEAAYKQVVGPNAVAAETMKRHPEIFGPAQKFAQARALSRTGSQQLDFSNPRTWHDLLEGANTELGKRLKAGSMGNLQGFRGSQSADYTIAVQRFNAQVRRMLGADFRKAQDIYSGASKNQEAVELGYDALTPGANDIQIGQTVRWMKKATPGQIQHMRVGALSRIADLLENADTGTGKSDSLRAIMRSTGQRRVLAELFGGDGKIDDLLRRLDIRRDLFDNTVRSGIGVNSHTADRILGAQAQQAQSRPTPANFLDSIYRLVMRESADQFDEKVSNNLIGLMHTPADDVLREMGGDIGQWAKGKGLLARAAQEQKRLATQRQRALRGAAISGLYYPIAGQAAAGYGT